MKNILLDIINEDWSLSFLTKFCADNDFVQLGSGKNSIVISNTEKLVYKIFYNDHPYIQFINFIKDKNNVHLPKIIDPLFKLKKDWYIISFEKLYHIPKDLYFSNYDLQYYCAYYFQNHKSLKFCKNLTNKELEKKAKKVIINPFLSLLNELDKIKLRTSKLDINSKNVMQRENGEWVITDPFKSSII